MELLKLGYLQLIIIVIFKMLYNIYNSYLQGMCVCVSASYTHNIHSYSAQLAERKGGF